MPVVIGRGGSGGGGSGGAPSGPAGGDLAGTYPNPTIAPGVVPTVLSYVERTTDLSVTATTEATAQTIVTAASVTLDGSARVAVDFYCSDVRSPGAAVSRFTLLVLFAAVDGGAAAPIGQFGMTFASVSTVISQTVNSRRVLTPAAGDYVYSARAFVNGGTGAVNAGLGGTADDVPAFIMVSTLP